MWVDLLLFTYFTSNEFYSIYFESFNNSAHVGKRLCKGRLAGSLQINRNSIFTMRCSKFFGSFRRQHHWLMDVFWKVWSQEQIKSILLSAWKQNKNHATFLSINALVAWVSDILYEYASKWTMTVSFGMKEFYSNA